MSGKSKGEVERSAMDINWPWLFFWGIFKGSSKGIVAIHPRSRSHRFYCCTAPSKEDQDHMCRRSWYGKWRELALVEELLKHRLHFFVILLQVAEGLSDAVKTQLSIRLWGTVHILQLAEPLDLLAVVSNLDETESC